MKCRFHLWDVKRQATEFFHHFKCVVTKRDDFERNFKKNLAFLLCLLIKRATRSEGETLV